MWVPTSWLRSFSSYHSSQLDKSFLGNSLSRFFTPWFCLWLSYRLCLSMQDNSAWRSAICIVDNEQRLIRSYYQTDCFSRFCLLWVSVMQSPFRLGGTTAAWWGCPCHWWCCVRHSNSASPLTQQVIISWLPCKPQDSRGKMRVWCWVEWIHPVSIFNCSYAV